MNELSLYILDITQNSITADSKNVHLTISRSIRQNLLTIDIIDDGKGMDEETVKKVVDPFFTTRTTRKVGLGIPLFKELCELCEGGLKIDSKVGVGTHLVATFKLDSIDLPPLGNLVDTLYILITNPQDVDIYYKEEVEKIDGTSKEFTFNTVEMKEALDGMSLNEPFVMEWFKEFVRNNEEELVK